MSSKKESRMAAKRRKVAAFLEIARLNDQDRRGKDGASQAEEVPEAEGEDDDGRRRKAGAERLSDKPLLAGEDYETLRARLRERKKRLTALPRFDLKRRGHDASVDVPANMRTALFPADLQALLAYTMVGDRIPYGPFDWCKLDKWNKVSGVLCLVVEGLSTADFETHREALLDLDSIFQHHLEFVSPESYGSSVARDLSFMPVGSSKLKTMARNYHGLEELMLRGAAFRVNRAFFPMKAKKEEGLNSGSDKDKDDLSLKLRLLLSAKQMVDENYPMPLAGPMGEKYKDFLLTKDEYEEVTEGSPLFSVDCEMCMTTNRLMELTRICVVDEELNVVYHTLVKPEATITNYLTQYSGITKSMLEDVETRLSDVQAALRELLPADAILVGQSLCSDLRALRMMHPYVIDTSVIYNLTGVRRRKTKLAVLAARFLGESIQQEGKLGHNPIEDAQAAMNLVKLKLEKGYEYGDVILNGTLGAIEDLADDEASTPKEEEKVGDMATTLLQQIQDCEKKATIACQKGLAGSYADIPGYEKLVQECEDGRSKKTVRKAVELAKQNDLVVCHVKLSDKEKVTKLTKEMWQATPPYGMLFSVWAGNVESNAMVSIAMKRDVTQQHQ